MNILLTIINVLFLELCNSILLLLEYWHYKLTTFYISHFFWKVWGKYFRFTGDCRNRSHSVWGNCDNGCLDTIMGRTAWWTKSVIVCSLNMVTFGIYFSRTPSFSFFFFGGVPCASKVFYPSINKWKYTWGIFGNGSSSSQTANMVI